MCTDDNLPMANANSSYGVSLGENADSIDLETLRHLHRYFGERWRPSSYNVSSRNCRQSFGSSSIGTPGDSGRFRTKLPHIVESGRSFGGYFARPESPRPESPVPNRRASKQSRNGLGSDKLRRTSGARYRGSNLNCPWKGLHGSFETALRTTLPVPA
jgi:hypothetical protein